MKTRLILDSVSLQIVLGRLCQELIENHSDFSQSLLIAMQPRGAALGKRLAALLSEHLQKEIPLGFLDATFHRDDFRRRDAPLLPNATNIPFLIEGKKVILIDDVLFTGRSIRAALDAMQAFGRPSSVEMLVLIDRKHSRELPIEAQYIGRKVNSQKQERVQVELSATGGHDALNDKVILSEPEAF